MLTERLDTIALAAGGKVLTGRPEMLVRGVFTDTRAPLQGGLFIALRGENFDGNAFARQALDSGAAAVLLDRVEAARGLPGDAGVILAPDSRAAYLGLAFHQRSQLTRPCWFGITGSVGKSSTKEMLAHVLEHAGRRRVHRAKASFNNAVGLSRTILDTDEAHEAVVLELGTNHPGEIAQLAAVARPDVAIITCAAESHLEAFGSVGGVAREKGEILSFQCAGSVAVLNADDAHFRYWRTLACGSVLAFGRSADADVRASQVSVDAEGRVAFMVRCGEALAECSLQIMGVHQVSNALAAIAAAHASGIRIEDAAAALNSYTGVARRLAVRNIHGVTVIDDAYNANPASFNAALETLKNYRAQRKFLVAGDMLELGPSAAQYHRQLGRLIADCDVGTVVTVGPLASLAGAAAVERRSTDLRWVSCGTPQEAAEALKPALRAGDVVLLKGSHSVHLEKCVEILSA